MYNTYTIYESGQKEKVIDQRKFFKLGIYKR